MIKKIAIFASGSGSNFEAIVKACRERQLNAAVEICICDRPGAYVLERAKNHDIPAILVNPKDFPDKEHYETFIADVLTEMEIDLVCLAGYMRIIGPTLLGRFKNKIINIHPSLLPAFKGAHAIRDALEYGVKVYGVTIHYVDETLDGGKIIAQEAFPYDGSNLEELEAKIHRVEHSLYPATINRLTANK